MAPSWPGAANPQRFTFTAGAAAPPGSAQQLPGSVDEDAGGAGVVEWRLRGQALPILSASRLVQALRHVQCRRCSASLQHSAANAAQLHSSLAALHVHNRRCVASLQRSTFQAVLAKMLAARELWSGAAKPQCRAPHSVQALLRLLAALHTHNGRCKAYLPTCLCVCGRTVVAVILCLRFQCMHLICF